MIGGVRFSPDGERLLSFSWDGTARTWRTHGGEPSRTFSDHRSVVEDGDFIRTRARVATIGDDGRLFVWEPETPKPETFRTESLLAHGSPLISLVVLPTTDDIVVRDTAGALWTASVDGKVTQIRTGSGVGATSMRASHDGRLLAIGHEDGSVVVYTTRDWAIARSFTMTGTIARIEFDPSGRDMLVHSETGFVHLVPLGPVGRARWRDFQVEARDITYSPDGEIVAISSVDGGAWFYSMTRSSWAYHADHIGTLRYGRFTPDGARFVSMDQTGTIIVRDSSSIFD
jgi:WD40 repeat protein